jgi:uncharacterized RDD family membrane protein YckC
MFCSRCGLMVEEGNRFCRGCGQQVEVAVPATPGTVNVPLASMGSSASVPAPLPYAGFWVRFAAYTIDGAILGIPFGFLVIVLLFLFGGFGLMMRRSALDPRAAAAFAGPLVFGFFIAMFFFVGLQWLYFAAMESSARQATFGKVAMSLIVTNVEGRRLSFGHATGRFFAKLVSGLIPLGIGYIMAAFTEKKQALHDMIAGTLVLRK